jgi:hypothetical protein
MKQTNGKVRRRKYLPEILIAMFRKAAALRNEMLAAGFTDNGGAIHSAERILNILGLVLKHSDLGHINNLRHSPKAVFSVEALKLHSAGTKCSSSMYHPFAISRKRPLRRSARGPATHNSRPSLSSTRSSSCSPQRRRSD